MTMIFNGAELEEVRFNGVDCEKVYFNGTLVFEKAAPYRSYIVIAEDPRDSSVRGCDLGYPFGDTNERYNWAFLPESFHRLRGVVWSTAGIRLLWVATTLAPFDKLTVRIGPVTLPNIFVNNITPLTTQQLNSLNSLGLGYQPLDLSM